MSYKVLEVEDKPFLNKESNDYLKHFTSVIPSKEFISQLALPNELTNHFQIHHSCIFKEIGQIFFEATLNFDVESSDVFVCSLPKCGSSWMQTIVWLLTHNLNYDAIRTMKREEQMGDFDEILNAKIAKEKASQMLASDKIKSLDEHSALQMAWNEVFKNIHAPRVIKTHNPVYFLPKGVWTKGAKVIYIVRNPKDMVVSLYHMRRNFLLSDVEMDDIVDGIINGSTGLSFPLEHMLNFWKIRHLPNVLFAAYGDIVNDSFSSIKQISEFLKCEYSDEQLKELVDFISFKNMKKLNSINREDDIVKMENLRGRKRLDTNFTFLRKGKNGGFHDELNEDQIKKLDCWIENRFTGTDFKFKF